MNDEPDHLSIGIDIGKRHNRAVIELIGIARYLPHNELMTVLGVAREQDKALYDQRHERGGESKSKFFKQ